MEAIFLLRAYRTTLPRFGVSEPMDTSRMRVERRISATWKDLPGGQILGSNFDYTHRLLDRGLAVPGTAPRDVEPERTAEDLAMMAADAQALLQEPLPRAMDALGEKDAEIIPRILSGQYKIAHKNVVELSKLSPPEIKKVERRIKKMQQPFIQYNQSRNAISEVSEGARGTVAATSIKDMPAFDPDADINGLALTIPSWSSSIDRVLKQTDLSIISSHAREGLVRQLLSLTDHVSDLLGAIKED